MKNQLLNFAILVCILLCSIQARSQTIAIQGGFSGATVSSADVYSDGDFKLRSKPGFHLGVMGEVPVAEKLSLYTGLQYDSRGFSTKLLDSDGSTEKARFNLSYLTIPIQVKYLFYDQDMKIFALGGPYIGIGLTGSLQSNYYDATTKESSNYKEKGIIHWSGSHNPENEDDYYIHLNPIDFGLTAGIGMERGPVRGILSYDAGINNISAYRDDFERLSNRTVKLSIAYIFPFKLGIIR